MNRFLLKLAMLLMFILAVLAGWGALSMTFSAGVWNLVLGIVAIFFFFRALELVDKVNKLGAYSEEEDKEPRQKGPRGPHTFGEGKPDEEPDINDLPDEE